MKKLLVFVTIQLSILLGGCGKNSSSSSDYPLLTPPVKAASPQGFVTGSSFTSELEFLHGLALDPADFKSRFFHTGPTDIFGLLQGIDDRISGINTRSASFPCENNTPTSYTITPMGQTVTMYAQCSETVSGSAGFVQWAKKGDSFYLYTKIGDGEVAAIASPSPSDASQTKVEAWISVGIVNLTGSHGVMQISADPAIHAFEMTAAGAGMGYCGAQYKSDGTNIYGTGSVDMGATCGAIDTICVLASDATTTATCSAGEMTLSLPAIGRKAYGSNGVSLYPASANITLSADGNDDTLFGPNAPTL